MTVRSRENFQFKIGQQNRTVKSCAKLACHSFAEGSITEEEFLILYEEYQSEEQGYKLKLASFQNCSRCFYFNFQVS